MAHTYIQVTARTRKPRENGGMWIIDAYGIYTHILAKEPTEDGSAKTGVRRPPTSTSWTWLSFPSLVAWSFSLMAHVVHCAWVLVVGSSSWKSVSQNESLLIGIIPPRYLYPTNIPWTNPPARCKTISALIDCIIDYLLNLTISLQLASTIDIKGPKNKRWEESDKDFRCSKKHKKRDRKNPTIARRLRMVYGPRLTAYTAGVRNSLYVEASASLARPCAILNTRSEISTPSDHRLQPHKTWFLDIMPQTLFVCSICSEIWTCK